MKYFVRQKRSYSSSLFRFFGRGIGTTLDRVKIQLAREDRGSALIEMALSSTILLSTILGVLVLSTALYSYLYVSYVTEEASRFASVRGSTCTGLGSACPASSSDVQNYVRNLNFPGVASSRLTVTTSWPDAASACGASGGINNCPGNHVQVSTTYTLPLSIPFVPQRTLSLTGGSIMVISQ